MTKESLCASKEGLYPVICNVQQNRKDNLDDPFKQSYKTLDIQFEKSLLSFFRVRLYMVHFTVF